MNRLLGTVMSEILSYDDMGNIKTLRRDNGAEISYTYTGNRLTSLSGGLTGSYTYDANGNATTDRTGIAFGYNHLNLPKTASKSGTSVNYLYDAIGGKLRKTATVGTLTTVRDYVGGIEYSKVGNGIRAIELIHTEEGYLQNSGGSYTYHYNLTDHSGNVRATLQRVSATAGTVIQKDDYYAFGKRKAIVTSGINRYLYNGKELQEELGQYDYGARFYDAEIGRWNVVDPLAENAPDWTPYRYGFNNPIRYTDPTGMWESDNIGIDKEGNVIYDDGIDDGNLFLVNEGAGKINDLEELKKNSIQLAKDFKWIGTGQQMVDYVKSQWTFAEGGFDWFPSTNNFIIRKEVGQGGFAIAAFSNVDGALKSTFSFNIPFYIYDVSNENHILSDPFNTRNAISNEKRHLQQNVQFQHGSLESPNRSLLELDAINYQKTVSSWQNTTSGFTIRINQYENKFKR